MAGVTPSIGDIIKMFQDGRIMVGFNQIDTEFFKMSPSKMLTILMLGYHPFTCDLVVLVTALLGCGVEKSKKQLWTLKWTTFGHASYFDSDIFGDVDVAVLRIHSNDRIFFGTGIPLAMITIDKGKTYTCSFRGKCRTLTIEKWVALYYETFISRIKYFPTAEFFSHDLRIIALYKPEPVPILHPTKASKGQSTFVAKRLFQADSRDMATIKADCLEYYNSYPKITDVSSMLNKKVTTRRSPVRTIGSVPSRPGSPRKSPKRTRVDTIETRDSETSITSTISTEEPALKKQKTQY